MIRFHALHNLRRYTIPQCWTPHTQTQLSYLILSSRREAITWRTLPPPPLRSGRGSRLRVTLCRNALLGSPRFQHCSPVRFLTPHRQDFAFEFERARRDLRLAGLDT